MEAVVCDLVKNGAGVAGGSVAVVPPSTSVDNIWKLYVSSIA